MLANSLRATRPATAVIKKSLHPATTRLSSRIAFARATTSSASPTMVASTAVNEVRLHPPTSCLFAVLLTLFVTASRAAGAEGGAGSCVLTAGSDSSSKGGAGGFCGLEAPSAPPPDDIHPPGSALTSCSSCNLAQTYEALAKKLKEVSALAGVQGLLGWDEMVMMPAGAAASRAAQKAALAGVLYDKQVDKEIGELLAKLQAANLEEAGLDAFQQANIREAARDYKKVTAVTKDIAQKEAELESHGYQTWVKARQESDFSQFAPVLTEWIELRKEKARLIDPSREVYDVNLDDYEKGMTAARLDEIFSQVKAGLVPLLAEIRSRGTAPSDAWLKGDFDTEKQAALCHKLAVALGFSLEKGRLDVSVHPFTGGAHPTDVRMTTRFKKEDVTEGITAAIHETGHALYEQGRNLEYDGLPVNSAMGMGVHESQSLLWERMVGLSKPFAAYLLPQIREAFPEVPADKSPEDLYAAMNIIKDPSFIRVEADEVTYPMHIILRYELERGLLDGSVSVDQLPALWNQKMKEYLGCEPETDAKGVLQDVHWSAGLFGYFPTYLLGAMYATQIFKTAEKELPGLSDDIAAGKFDRLRQWLNDKIHRVGSLHTSGDELMKVVTGSPLDPSVFLGFLKEKYSELYKL